METLEQIKTHHMNITQETWDSPDKLAEHLNTVHCEESCMVQKRKDNGLPELDVEPIYGKIQDVNLETDLHILTSTNAGIMLSNERYENLCYMATMYQSYDNFQKSIWYKLYKFFN